MATEVELRRFKHVSGKGFPISVDFEPDPSLECLIRAHRNDTEPDIISAAYTDDGFAKVEIFEPGLYEIRSTRAPGVYHTYFLAVGPDGGCSFMPSANERDHYIKTIGSAKTDNDRFGRLHSENPKVIERAFQLRETVFKDLETGNPDKDEALCDIIGVAVDASWWLERAGIPSMDILLEICSLDEGAMEKLLALK